MNNQDVLLLFFLLSLVGNFIVMKYGAKITFIKASQVQDTHQGIIPRIGGLILITLFFIYGINAQIISFDFILISSLFLIPALFEDFGIHIKPLIRFFLIIISCLLLILNLESLPHFNLEFMNFILNNTYFQIIFFTLALSSIINGQNIIDGTNGHSASTAVIIFICIGYLGYEINDPQIIQIAIFLIIILISFLFFNYPFGKIFLGDAGSYFIGLMGGYLIIKIFATNPQLPTWSAVIVLFYPAFEVVFSFFRKILSHKSPFLPDNKHLHLKIFFLLSSSSFNSIRLCNALVAPFLSIIWLSPLVILPISLALPDISLLLLCGLILKYLLFYFAIPDPE